MIAPLRQYEVRFRGHLNAYTNGISWSTIRDFPLFSIKHSHVNVLAGMEKQISCHSDLYTSGVNNTLCYIVIDGPVAFYEQILLKE